MLKNLFKDFADALPIPPRLRHALVNFYLVNVERTHDAYVAGLTPAHLRSALKLSRILNHDQGYLRSFAEGRCLDSRGQPVPWYTYPALEHLSQLDFSGKTVFEYGAGNSTLWWARRAKSVTSVEIREPWYQRIKSSMPDNCQLMLETDPEAYINSINKFPQGFDVIVVDGYARRGGRLRCAMLAVERLRPKGKNILDNADWLPMSARFLSNSGLLEINMAGFSPLNSYAGVTSLFLTRDCDIARRDLSQPATAIGGVPRLWETDANVPAELRERAQDR